jgi:hypothetical protein
MAGSEERISSRVMTFTGRVGETDVAAAGFEVLRAGLALALAISSPPAA